MNCGFTVFGLRIFLLYSFTGLLAVIYSFKFPDEVDIIRSEVLDTGKMLARPPLRIFSKIADRLIDGVGASREKAQESEEGREKTAVVSHDVAYVRFFLYDDIKSPNSYTELIIGDVELARSTSLNPHKETKILIHGFRQSFKSEFPQEAKNAYLIHTDHNVICVDWGHLSKPNARIGSLFYPFVTDNVPLVGDRVAELIMFLRRQNLISSLDLVHIIGFSLGAHVAGLAGSSVIARASGYRERRVADSNSGRNDRFLIETRRDNKVGRITGLDPAGPQFLTTSSDNRLDDTDAQFVDIIHTNEGQLGFLGRLGHADFYPNGGSQQPNCLDMDDHLLSSINQALSGSCNHFKSAIYFTRSISTAHFIACKCNSWVDYKTRCRNSCNKSAIFGEHCYSSARGKYYLSIKE